MHSLRPASRRGSGLFLVLLLLVGALPVHAEHGDHGAQLASVPHLGNAAHGLHQGGAEEPHQGHPRDASHGLLEGPAGDATHGPHQGHPGDGNSSPHHDHAGHAAPDPHHGHSGSPASAPEQDASPGGGHDHSSDGTHDPAPDGPCPRGPCPAGAPACAATLGAPTLPVLLPARVLEARVEPAVEHDPPSVTTEPPFRPPRDRSVPHGFFLAG
jgi:hypothetical protein